MEAMFCFVKCGVSSHLIKYSYGARHRYLMLSIYVPLVGTSIMLVKILGVCRVIEIKIVLGKEQFVINAVKLPMDK